MFKPLTLLSALLLVPIALAGNSPVGNWVGHVEINEAKMRKAENPDQQKQRAQLIKVIKSISIKLSLKADKSFMIKQSAEGQPESTVTGDYKLSGTKIELNLKTANGKSVAGKIKNAPSFTISADGKTLSQEMNGQKVVFKRA